MVNAQKLLPYIGLGADPTATQLTRAAADALDTGLENNLCNTCDDLRGPLRQLVFAFKAACLTDPGIAPFVNLNMSTPLAMSGFGPGTHDALLLVNHGEHAPCTDADGNCLANPAATPQIPATMTAVTALFSSAVQAAVDQLGRYATAGITIDPGLQQTFLDRLKEEWDGFLQKLPLILTTKGENPLVPQPATPATPATPPPDDVGGLVGYDELSKGPGGKQPSVITPERVAIGILIGIVVIGGVAYAVHVSKKR